MDCLLLEVFLTFKKDNLLETDSRESYHVSTTTSSTTRTAGETHCTVVCPITVPFIGTAVSV